MLCKRMTRLLAERSFVRKVFDLTVYQIVKLERFQSYSAYPELTYDLHVSLTLITFTC
jgi:hypothetical protein